MEHEPAPQIITFQNQASEQAKGRTNQGANRPESESARGRSRRGARAKHQFVQPGAKLARHFRSRKFKKRINSATTQYILLLPIYSSNSSSIQHFPVT